MPYCGQKRLGPSEHGGSAAECRSQVRLFGVHVSTSGRQLLDRILANRDHVRQAHISDVRYCGSKKDAISSAPNETVCDRSRQLRKWAILPIASSATLQAIQTTDCRRDLPKMMT